jgi:hypothetical protein
MKEKISIRISDNLKDRLSEMSELNKVSVSELSRTILEDYFTNADNEHQKDTLEKYQSPTKDVENYFDEKPLYDELDYENDDIVYSVEFLQLVVWIYDQKGSRKIKITNKEIELFKKTIIKIHSSLIVKQKLKDEFNKVFVDLIKESTSSYPFYYTPEFAYRDVKGFNFTLLTEFIFKEDLGQISITI